jgi:prepilin-type N-terminal cleavage/methylation domain-containing protein
MVNVRLVSQCRSERGFSLAELAISLAIIATLLVAIFKGQAVLSNAKADSVIGTVRDISSAARAFKERYRYLPGDFPIETSTPEIAGVRSACLRGNANGGNGNGRIDASGRDESVCVPEHLIQAGFLKGNPSLDITTDFGIVRVVSLADSKTQVARASASLGLIPSNITHVIEFYNLPCEIAKAIDMKLDDGDLDNGSIRASVASCSSGNVAFVAVPL